MSRCLKILTVITVLIFLTGVGFLLFPPVSNCVGGIQADSAANKLDEVKENVQESVVVKGKKITSVEQLEKEPDTWVTDENGNPVVFKRDIERLREDSLKYNKRLLTKQGSEAMIGFERAALNLQKYGIFDGVYCYITAPDIGLRLPVYLGSSEQKMSYGAAHMFGTSLPTGGKATNSAIAGHTGYIGRIFFDNIRSLKVGSEVIVTTYWSRLHYKVTGSTVIKPTDTKDLVLDGDSQKLELLTCIDNGKGGFDRYVVLCERAKN